MDHEAFLIGINVPNTLRIVMGVVGTLPFVVRLTLGGRQYDIGPKA